MSDGMAIGAMMAGDMMEDGRESAGTVMWHCTTTKQNNTCHQKEIIISGVSSLLLPSAHPAPAENGLREIEID